MVNQYSPNLNYAEDHKMKFIGFWRILRFALSGITPKPKTSQKHNHSCDCGAVGLASIPEETIPQILQYHGVVITASERYACRFLIKPAKDRKVEMTSSKSPGRLCLDCFANKMISRLIPKGIQYREYPDEVNGKKIEKSDDVVMRFLRTSFGKNNLQGEGNSDDYNGVSEFRNKIARDIIYEKSMIPIAKNSNLLKKSFKLNIFTIKGDNKKHKIYLKASVANENLRRTMIPIAKNSSLIINSGPNIAISKQENDKESSQSKQNSDIRLNKTSSEISKQDNEEESFKFKQNSDVGLNTSSSEISITERLDEITSSIEKLLANEFGITLDYLEKIIEHKSKKSKNYLVCNEKQFITKHDDDRNSIDEEKLHVLGKLPKTIENKSENEVNATPTQNYENIKLVVDVHEDNEVLDDNEVLEGEKEVDQVAGQELFSL